MAYAIELDAPKADDKAFGHDTPFDCTIKIRSGALARPSGRGHIPRVGVKKEPLLTRGLVPRSGR